MKTFTAFDSLLVCLLYVEPQSMRWSLSQTQCFDIGVCVCKCIQLHVYVTCIQCILYTLQCSSINCGLQLGENFYLGYMLRYAF